MREAIAALESVLHELTQARKTLPPDLADEVDRLAEKTRSLIESLARSSQGERPN